MRIIISGASGKMGKAVAARAALAEEAEIVCGIDRYDDGKASFPIFAAPSLVSEQADVIIDFSNPALLPSLLDFATERALPAVIATTGLSADDRLLLEEAAKSVPIFVSGNMSLGISLVMSLVKKAAEVLKDGFDIEIIEKHHNQKIDAPSGTALMLASAAQSAFSSPMTQTFDRHSRRAKREKNEIGIHSIRAGSITGEHTVLFGGADEIVEIKHTATSKDIFAAGALRAAAFIIGKPAGLYNMEDLVGKI